jgi:hypothetical protein
MKEYSRLLTSEEWRKSTVRKIRQKPEKGRLHAGQKEYYKDAMVDRGYQMQN